MAAMSILCMAIIASVARGGGAVWVHHRVDQPLRTNAHPAL
jgi:hypothetical protein